jgi:hypothetical protein
MADQPSDGSRFDGVLKECMNDIERAKTLLQFLMQRKDLAKKLIDDPYFLNIEVSLANSIFVMYKMQHGIRSYGNAITISPDKDDALVMANYEQARRALSAHIPNPNDPYLVRLRSMNKTDQHYEDWLVSKQVKEMNDSGSIVEGV